MPNRILVSVFSLSLLAGTAAVAGAQEPPPPPPTPPAAQQPAEPAQPTEPAIAFTSDAGMMFNMIKSAHTADFEMVLGRLKEALQKSENPARLQQAASWKVYKSTDPSPDGNVLYLFIFDQAVKDADYDPVKILSEAFPTEVNALYEKLTLAYASLNKAGLAKIMDMGPAGMKEIQ
ncbi:MAG TPA: hypothetical protein VMN81_04870 [Vicinamibacterales bacterium]|nr:hypothetical protein [Vicinamibacterales bacterium]